MIEREGFYPGRLYPGLNSFHLGSDVFHFYLIYWSFYPGLFHFNSDLLLLYSAVFDPAIVLFIIHFDIVSLLRVNKQAMRTIHFNIPDDVDLKDYDFSMIIASKLYEDGILSSGQAAELAGLSKWTFIELLGRYGVPVFSKSLSDLESDISNA